MLSAEKPRGAYRVTDLEAYGKFCHEHEAVDSYEEMVWTRLAPIDYWKAYSYLKEHHPDLFVYHEQPMEPTDDWLELRKTGIFDTATGLKVPGVVWVPDMDGGE